jgi:hypothetical protein
MAFAVVMTDVPHASVVMVPSYQLSNTGNDSVLTLHSQSAMVEENPEHFDFLRSGVGVVDVVGCCLCTMS